jgi:hypothetical protein
MTMVTKGHQRIKRRKPAAAARTASEPGMKFGLTSTSGPGSDTSPSPQIADFGALDQRDRGQS